MEENMPSFLSRDHQLAKGRECKIFVSLSSLPIRIDVCSYFAISFFMFYIPKVAALGYSVAHENTRNIGEQSCHLNKE
jgi:hypothetical protein